MSIPVKNPIIFQNTPCTLVTGFLGAGKTTVINQLLASKPDDERWALLINEFGRIGIDGALLASSQDNDLNQKNIAIREISGGCICCTSQLPLQIAISRLLSEHHPQRLLIEPTGLAHPRELILQLSAPHWQTALKMNAVITVLSGEQWQQIKYRDHDGFQAHVRDADVLIINRYTQLNTSEKQTLVEWITKLNSQVKIIWAASGLTASETTDSSDVHSSDKFVANKLVAEAYLTTLNDQLNQPSSIISNQRKVSISNPKKSMIGVQSQVNSLAAAPSSSSSTDESEAQANPQTSANSDLPYRYHEEQQDFQLAGWRLPAHYILNANDLQDWLLALPNWQRIKGVVHTSDGWMQINFNPGSLTTKTIDPQTDSRLEIILQLDNAVDTNAANTDIEETENDAKASSIWIDWEECDRELMALVI
ncbi:MULTISPECIES: GTP-binding protein [Psychrobacter]|nr:MULTISPECIES: GTP-binding protein [Psychrobacter]TEW87599.1 GTP-binding protein [Psychrobacter sp. 230]MBA6244897.1 GTP-binding protein [Psychrobacter sp. Urea-trap-18]MBA6286442.1 GTP-binding protein [Psychrobacter sp. Urea-trap-16]MBA6318453.1 GTP-binding protein [Psychrobacter sp. Urea-trap-20]MBA6334674.1 GTP-binding protein [Psychrobacter sp. Urea-trap-19]